MSLLLPAWAGPWLGRRVRRRGWPAQREWWALLAAVVAVVGAVALFEADGAEPMKQRIAEATGNVGPDGKRRRVVMMVGVSVSRQDDGARGGPLPAPRADSIDTALNALTRVALGFLLAGGLALRGWWRERAGLAALAQERALAEAQAQRREAERRLSVLAAQVASSRRSAR